MALLKTLGLSTALLASHAVAFSQTPGDPTEPISAALRAREFDKAVELTRSALQVSPGDARLWTLQGIAFAGKGDSEQALAAFRQALEISPDNVAALAGAAQIEFEADDPEAIPLLERLIRLRPGEPTGHAMLAVLQFRRGNCEAAVPHFEGAGALLGSQLEALHAYAVCLVRLERFDDAIAVFQKALALRPNDPRERHVLASIQIKAQKPQDAVATLQPLLDAGNPSVDTLQLASSAFEDAGDTPQAVSTLRQALVNAPRNVSLYLDFANIAFAHQSFQVGIDVIDEGIALQPAAAQLYVARGVLYVQLAQYDKAMADFEKADELDPHQSLSAAAQGLAAVEANDLDRALALIQSKLAQTPDDAALLYLQADVLSEMGAEVGTPDFQLAMRSAKRAVSLQPTLGSAHAVLAKLHMQAEEYPEAIEQCRQALKRDPDDRTALYRLIQALRKTGQMDELPGLLKRFAELRDQATQDEKERYRYKLFIEDDSPAEPPGQP